MAKIISKRGKKIEVPEQDVSPEIPTGVQTHIFDIGQTSPGLTPEEQEEIGRVFKSIREQLDKMVQKGCS